MAAADGITRQLNLINSGNQSISQPDAQQLEIGEKLMQSLKELRITNR